MPNEMMCFVVVNKNNRIKYQGMQIDDGAAAYALSKKTGATVRKWEMYGLSHLYELDDDTRKEIKSYIKGLRKN